MVSSVPENVITMKSWRGLTCKEYGVGLAHVVPNPYEERDEGCHDRFSPVAKVLGVQRDCHLDGHGDVLTILPWRGTAGVHLTPRLASFGSARYAAPSPAKMLRASNTSAIVTNTGLCSTEVRSWAN